MAAFTRHLAPAGAPIGAADIARWLPMALAPGGPVAALGEALRTRLGARHYVLSSTGRAGMTLLFRALRRMAPASRDEIVLPTYTCYSLAASAAKAGLRIRLVDIDPDTLDYAPASLAAADFSRVLAVVVTNLYGLPGDLPFLERLARDRGVFLVDDAAQAMGATVNGRPSGTWGDAGLFSFDKGKNVCAIDGGVVTTASDAVADELARETATIGRPSAAASAIHVARALAYAALLRPSLYGLVTRVPQLELGKTVFTTAFPLDGPDPALAALAAVMLPRLDAFTRARRANAAALLDGLAALSTVRAVRTIPGAAAVYLRLPVLCATESIKQRAITALNDAGIGATGSYPASLADVPEVQSLMVPGPVTAEGGRHVARSIVTLPTHPFITRADVTHTLEVLAAVAGSPHRLGEDH